MTTQFMQQLEGKIAYESTGSGPLVVAVPGMGDLRQSFRFLTPQLVEAGYRVVTMDVRGHGETDTSWADYSVAGVGQDILALIREVDVGPAIVVSNSMGGGASVWAAAERPELIRGLVLLDPAVRGEVKGFFRLVIDALFARPWGPSTWIMYFKNLFKTRKPQDLEEYTAKLKGNLRERGRMEALHQMMLAPQSAAAARLSRVSAPSLVLMGSRDPDYKDPQAEASWIAQQMNGSYRMIEGAGHYPHVEMPDVTGPLVLAFLQQIEIEVNHGAIIHS